MKALDNCEERAASWKASGCKGPEPSSPERDRLKVRVQENIDAGFDTFPLGANIHISLECLYASKYIIVTATPMPNGVESFGGYMPFLESREADEWWSPESLADMDFEEDANPYDLADDHPAAKLQLTRKAVKDWIYALRVDPVTKGARLQKIWKRVMIRRTNSGRPVCRER